MRLARRTVQRAFRRVYGEGPLAIPHLRHLARTCCSEEWEGDRVVALVRLIEKAASKLPSEPFEHGAEMSWQEFARRMYNTVGENLDHVDGRKDTYLRDTTFAAAGLERMPKRTRTKRAEDLRDKLAHALANLSRDQETGSSAPEEQQASAASEAPPADTPSPEEPAEHQPRIRRSPQASESAIGDDLTAESADDTDSPTLSIGRPPSDLIGVDSSPEKTSEREPPRVRSPQRYWRSWPRKTRIVMAVATAVLLFTASAAIVADSSSGSSSRTNTNLSAIGNPDGESLLITVAYGNSAGNGYSMVFPETSGQIAKDYLGQMTGRTAGASIDRHDGFLEAMQAGAYSYGGVSLELNMEGQNGREVSVTNIRPIVRQKYDIVTGSLLYYPGAAGPMHTIYYDLDKPNSVPKDNASDGPPFFTTQRIGVTTSSPERVILNFSALQGAYDFNIAVDYVVNGQTYTQIVKLSQGAPDAVFHVTGGLCNLAGTHSPGQVEQLQKAGYDKIFRFAGDYNDNSGANGFAVVTSQAFVQHDCT